MSRRISAAVGVATESGDWAGTGGQSGSDQWPAIRREFRHAATRTGGDTNRGRRRGGATCQSASQAPLRTSQLLAHDQDGDNRRPRELVSQSATQADTRRRPPRFARAVVVGVRADGQSAGGIAKYNPAALSIRVLIAPSRGAGQPRPRPTRLRRHRGRRQTSGPRRPLRQRLPSNARVSRARKSVLRTNHEQREPSDGGYQAEFPHKPAKYGPLERTAREEATKRVRPVRDRIKASSTIATAHRESASAIAARGTVLGAGRSTQARAAAPHKVAVTSGSSRGGACRRAKCDRHTNRREGRDDQQALERRRGAERRHSRPRHEDRRYPNRVGPRPPRAPETNPAGGPRTGSWGLHRLTVADPIQYYLWVLRLEFP